MKISVIMVCFNAQDNIKRSIESFICQDYTNKELIIIDGASTDNTLDIINNINGPEIKLFSESDQGIYDAMNKGLKEISGDAFGFLNSDDCFARNDVLSIVSQRLVNNDIVSGTLNFVIGHGGKNPVRVWKPKEYTPDAFKFGYGLPHPTTYAKKTVLDRVGSFDVSYKSAGDYDWLLRAISIEKIPVHIIDLPMVNMKLGGASTKGVRSLVTNAVEMRRVRKKHSVSGLVDTALLFNFFIKFRQWKWPGRSMSR